MPPTLRQYTLQRFGGLNEVDPPDEVGLENATSLLNVQWDGSTGSIRRRSGIEALDDTFTDTTPYVLGSRHDNYMLVEQTDGGVITAEDFDGTSIAGVTGFGVITGALLGTPTATYTYLTLYGYYPLRFDGTTFSSRASLPQAQLVTVQPSDNRLVMANTDAGATGPGAATSSRSHVWFSDAGDPETWDPNNYVILTPGDTETIVGLVTWNNQVFAFKKSTLFIFYGTSTDADGNPIFNYRTVSLRGAEMASFSDNTPQGSVTVAPEGIYYMGERGVYLTTGDAPVLVSSQLDISPSEHGVDCFLGYVGDKLYLHPDEGDSYVYDFRVQEWTKTSVSFSGRPIRGLTEGNNGAAAVDLGSECTIAALDTDADDDEGTDISAYYVTGLSNLGTESPKRLRYVDVWGTGNVSVSVASDYEAPSNFSVLTLGTSTVQRARYDTSARGTLFGLRFATSAAPFEIHRVTLHFEDDSSPSRT